MWLAHSEELGTRRTPVVLELQSLAMALSCSREFAWDEFVDDHVNQPPHPLGAVAKSKADEKKPFNVIELEEDNETRLSETTDEAVSEEEHTPMCAGSVTSTPSSHTSWRDVMPMKVPISPSRWKEIAQCLLPPMHVTTAPKSSQIIDATMDSRGQCSPKLRCSLSSRAQEIPDKKLRRRGMRAVDPPSRPDRPEAARGWGGGGVGGANLGQFLRRFVFTGFDAVNHADFELVPRLIGRGGGNMSAIREACNAYIRVNKGASIEKPVEVVLRCENQEDLDEGINRVTTLLENIRVHFTRFCRKRGISPVPELYHILS